MFQCIQIFFISQLDPGAQKDQIPELAYLARLALEFSVQREQQCIFLHCHRLSITIDCIVSALPFLLCHFLFFSLFSPGARLYCTGEVQCTLHYVEMHCRSFCLSFTLWRTAEQRRKAFWRPRLSPVHI